MVDSIVESIVESIVGFGIFHKSSGSRRVIYDETRFSPVTSNRVAHFGRGPA
jgi:hypothetical protein